MRISTVAGVVDRDRVTANMDAAKETITGCAEGNEDTESTMKLEGTVENTMDTTQGHVCTVKHITDIRLGIGVGHYT